MRRWLKRLAYLGLAMMAFTAIAIAALGSGFLVSPPRRKIQDYHRAILGDEAGYGLEVHDLGRLARAPAHLYLPSKSPGLARKSRALRSELTRRGIKLPPWGATVGTIVLLHGHKGRKEDHLPIAERFCAAGFACLVCDLPGHGDHPAATATFGKTEVAMIAGLLAAARARHPLPEPTALFGISQGGAIALQAVGDNNPAYFAVASVASFAALDAIVADGVRDFHPVTRTLSGPCTMLVRLGTRVRAGFDPAEIRPAEAAAGIMVPVFIGHGGLDAFIPGAHAQLIFDAIPHTDKSLKFVSDGTHGNVLAKGGNAFYADLAEFFLQHLPSNVAKSP